jgi:hypothetical protein
MIYDPDQQNWDPTATRLGEEVCDLFCPYYEKDALDDLIRRCA